MIKAHILDTIKLAHFYHSAFDRDQLYNYLRIKINRAKFDSILEALINEDIISEHNGFIFNGDLRAQHEQQRKWSREIHNKYKFYIKLLEIFPWIKFVSLTGSNAFESCKEEDDLDIFLITRIDRLWLCYFYIIIMSKILRKRRVLCINYLVDENNLSLSKKTYYTAVQLIQMVPLYNKPLKQKLINSNPWILNHLPNVHQVFNTNKFDLLKNTKKSRRHIFPDFIKILNKVLFEKYYKRIAEKFPDYLGSSMILKEGIAKLHHIDNHDLYDSLNARGVESIKDL